MSVLLDMNNTDISQEGMVYESGVDSDVSPNNSLSFSQLTPYTTPPNFALNRFFFLTSWLSFPFSNVTWYKMLQALLILYVSEM